MESGRQDLDRAAAALASRLPWTLAPLARLAYNYRWCWMPDGPELFRSIDPPRWRATHGNPVRFLQEAHADGLLRAAADKSFVAKAEAFERLVRDDIERPFTDRVPGISAERPVAFFCAEYGVHASMPIYSGGLGVLAGDILKAASDRAVPMVAVGLMYRRGYFRQRIDASGWQQEYWVPTDPERTPAVRVTDGEHSRPVTVKVAVGDETVCAQIWRLEVGRVPLFLLDTDLPENDRVSRWITSRLYDGDPETRLAQYALLGLGGAAALRELGIEPGVMHLNEGHAAFTAIEAARALAAGNGSFEAALERVRSRSVFTTHTPVPAGNDTYPPDRIVRLLGKVAADCGIDAWDFVRRGRTHPDDDGEPFGVTQFALRSSRSANGVSRRHGGVSRGMWRGLWPGKEVDDVPISHVTNGVHTSTWIGPPMRRLLDEHLGPDWPMRDADPDLFRSIDAIPAADLWAVRQEQRRRLVEWVRDRSVSDRVARGDPRQYAMAAAEAFDPEALTIGFARRLATYKRLNLILRDPGRALAVLGGDRPIQLVMAGKAHPKDDDGKRLVQGLFAFRDEPAVSERVVYVEDYDMDSAARLVRGCDVWVNLPRPPLEASGTSGMKSVVNGGLQLSVLDGWWAEAYDGTNGWALPGEEDDDHHAQDDRDAANLYRLIEEEVSPEFHRRDADGVPHDWIARVKRSMAVLIPQFSASRMVRDYEDRVYTPSQIR